MERIPKQHLTGVICFAHTGSGFATFLLRKNVI